MTNTRDTSDYALHYLSAQLRLENERHFTNISRASRMSVQNIQHFMSNSPWEAQHILWQVQFEIAHTSSLRTGGVLLLDESADKKSSPKTAGAARQYNGRLGKVETKFRFEMSQVGTFLAFAHLQTNTWTWVDGELYLPEAWFAQERAEERKRLGIPQDRAFATKIELGWKMIQRVRENGLAFEALACDDLYARKDWFRSEMNRAGILYMADVPCYMADVPCCTRVYPASPAAKEDATRTVQEVAADPSTAWQSVTVRPTQRGWLTDRFAAVPVFTWRDECASSDKAELRYGW